MNDLNHLTICGTLINDSVFNISEKNIKYTSFTIVTNRARKIVNSDGTVEWQSEGSFINLSVFGDYAEKIAKQLIKGRKIIVEGYLRQDRWEKDGKKHSKLGITVEKIHILYDKKSKDEIPEINEEIIEENEADEVYNNSYQSEIFSNENIEGLF